jgi:hypothetical protein
VGEKRELNRTIFWADLEDQRHGTTNGYNNLSCRCERCCQANTDYHLRYMREHPEQRQKAADSNMRRTGRDRKQPYAPREHLWRDLDDPLA